MSDINEVQGTVKYIGEIEVFASGFQKRTFVIETKDGNYTNEYAFDLMKDNGNQADGIEVGDDVSVKFNMGTSREYNGKYYTNHAVCWALKKTGDAAPSAPAGDVTTADPDSDAIPF